MYLNCREVSQSNAKSNILGSLPTTTKQNREEFLHSIELVYDFIITVLDTRTELLGLSLLIAPQML